MKGAQKASTPLNDITYATLLVGVDGPPNCDVKVVIFFG